MEPAFKREVLCVHFEFKYHFRIVKAIKKERKRFKKEKVRKKRIRRTRSERKEFI